MKWRNGLLIKSVTGSQLLSLRRSINFLLDEESELCETRRTFDKDEIRYSDRIIEVKVNNVSDIRDWFKRVAYS